MSHRVIKNNPIEKSELKKNKTVVKIITIID